MESVPSMAAALAASMPAPSAAPTTSAPVQEVTIPASMNKAIDVEAEIPITAIQLDGIVVSKIAKHAKDSSANPAIAHGLLLGLDLDGVLEITNSFPIPTHLESEDDKSAKSAARYQASMLRSLKEVQGDDGVVGFYQVTSLGAFFNQSLMDTQAIHQDKLRHGGIVLVHDVQRTAQDNTSFRAFRLSKAFLGAHKQSSFNTASLQSHQLTFSHILEEVTLKVRTNALMNSFLSALQKTTPSRSPYTTPADTTSSALPPSFANLELGGNNTAITKNLEQIIDGLDAYKNEEGNLAYLSRQIARERQKADNYVSKRKEENATRIAQGLTPLPEEDVNRLFKIPAEPSRLESLLLLGQLDGYGKSLETGASSNLVKMYAAKASSSVEA